LTASLNKIQIRIANSDVLVQSGSALNRWRNYFNQLWNINLINEVRLTEIHTDKPLMQEKRREERRGERREERGERREKREERREEKRRGVIPRNVVVAKHRDDG
jgi:hypothetical protein